MKIKYSIYIKTNPGMYDDILDLLREYNLVYGTSYNGEKEELKIEIMIEETSLYPHILLIQYVKDFPNNNIKLESEILRIGEI